MPRGNRGMIPVRIVREAQLDYDTAESLLKAFAVFCSNKGYATFNWSDVNEEDLDVLEEYEAVVKEYLEEIEQ